ncbi:hypothetical protein D3C77_319450 [compost metagenome]
MSPDKYIQLLSAFENLYHPLDSSHESVPIDLGYHPDHYLAAPLRLEAVGIHLLLLVNWRDVQHVHALHLRLVHP